MRLFKSIPYTIGIGVLIISFQNCAAKNFQTSSTDAASLELSSPATSPNTGSTPAASMPSDPNSPLNTPAYAFCSPFVSSIKMLNQPIDPTATDRLVTGLANRVSIASAAAVNIRSLGAISVNVQRSESVTIANAATDASIVTRNLLSVSGFTGELRANAVNVGDLHDFASLWVAVNAQNLSGEISSAAGNFCLSVQTIDPSSSIHDIAGEIVIISRRAAPLANPVLSRITRVASPIILENVDVNEITDFAGVVILINSHVKHIGRGAALIWTRNSIIDQVDDSAVLVNKF